MGKRNKLKKQILKDKIKNTTKGTWAFLIIMSLFIISAIALIFIGMHMSGYSLVTFMRKFYGWFVLVGTIVVVALLMWGFYNYRKGR